MKNAEGKLFRERQKEKARNCAERPFLYEISQIEDGKEGIDAFCVYLNERLM